MKEENPEQRGEEPHLSYLSNEKHSCIWLNLISLFIVSTPRIEDPIFYNIYYCSCLANVSEYNQTKLTVLAGALTPIANVSVENKTYRKNREISNCKDNNM